MYDGPERSMSIVLISIARRTGKRELEHCEPVTVAADDLAGLVRGPSGRDPDDALQTERRAQGIRDVKMPVVNRIEGSAENADAPWLLGFRHDAPAEVFVATVASGNSDAQSVNHLVIDAVPRSCSTVTSMSVPSGPDWMMSTTGSRCERWGVPRRDGDDRALDFRDRVARSPKRRYFCRSTVPTDEFSMMLEKTTVLGTMMRSPAVGAQRRQADPDLLDPAFGRVRREPGRRSETAAR